jgi:hypothetical protein
MVYQTVEGYITKLKADDFANNGYPRGDIFISPFNGKRAVRVWADTDLYLIACKAHAEGWPVFVRAMVMDEGSLVADMIKVKIVMAK